MNHITDHHEPPQTTDGTQPCHFSHLPPAQEGRKLRRQQRKDAFVEQVNEGWDRDGVRLRRQLNFGFV